VEVHVVTWDVQEIEYVLHTEVGVVVHHHQREDRGECQQQDVHFCTVETAKNDDIVELRVKQFNKLHASVKAEPIADDIMVGAVAPTCACGKQSPGT
jgi:hypothetical protein